MLYVTGIIPSFKRTQVSTEGTQSVLQFTWSCCSLSTAVNRRNIQTLSKAMARTILSVVLGLTILGTFLPEVGTLIINAFLFIHSGTPECVNIKLEIGLLDFCSEGLKM